MVPGQRAGSGKAAAGFRSPRAFGRAVRDEYKKTDLFGGVQEDRPLWGGARGCEGGSMGREGRYVAKKTDLFEGALRWGVVIFWSCTRSPGVGA